MWEGREEGGGGEVKRVGRQEKGEMELGFRVLTKPAPTTLFTTTTCFMICSPLLTGGKCE